MKMTDTTDSSDVEERISNKMEAIYRMDSNRNHVDRKVFDLYGERLFGIF